MILQTKATLFSLPLSFSPSLALPFPTWVSTSSDPGSQDRAINGTLLQFLQCDAKIYEFVTKDVKMIWLSSVKAWLIKLKAEAQFKFLTTKNATGWYQLSSQQVNFDRLSRLWFSFYLFIRIFDQLICLQCPMYPMLVAIWQFAQLIILYWIAIGYTLTG